MRSAGLKIDMRSGLTGKGIAYAFAAVGDLPCRATHDRRAKTHGVYELCGLARCIRRREPQRCVKELDLHQDLVFSPFRFDCDPSRDASCGGRWGKVAQSSGTTVGGKHPHVPHALWQYKCIRSSMLLITGASGRIGHRVAELVSSAGHRTRLMTRNPQGVPKIPRAEWIRGDFTEPATLEAAFSGITAALVISGSGEPSARAIAHRNAFETAARAGVRHIIYLSLQGSSPTSKYPYSRDHYESELFLAATGLSHTILRNAFYIDMFLDLFDSQGVIRGPAGDGRGAFVSREDAAQSAAAALIATSGGTHDVTRPEAVAVTQVAARLSGLTGSMMNVRQRLDSHGYTRRNKCWKLQAT